MSATTHATHTPDGESRDGLAAARGIVLGLLISSPTAVLIGFAIWSCFQ